MIDCVSFASMLKKKAILLFLEVHKCYVVVEPTHLKNMMLVKKGIFPKVRGEKKTFETTTKI